MPITAKRGGQTRTFDDKSWMEMPGHKYGWLPVTDVPEEVKALQEKQQSEESQTSETRNPVTDVPEEVKAKPGRKNSK